MVPLYNKEIENVSVIPSIPEVVAKVLEAIDDFRITNKSIAQMISLDPVITAKILAIANSANFASTSEITNLDRAITRVGRQEIKNIVVTIHIAETMKKLETPHVNRRQIWHHSLAVAFIAKRLIASFYPMEKNAEVENMVYLSALMHDIGYMIFDNFNPIEFEQTLLKAKEEDIQFHKIELRKFNSNHGYEAAKLLADWNLADRLIEAIKYHHNPSESDDIIAHTIHVADYISHIIDYPGLLGMKNVELIKQSWSLFKFDEETEEKIDEIFKSFLEQSKLFISFAELIVA